MYIPDIQSCIKGNRQAQQQFFDQFKGKMFALCQRYARNREDAEDILQEGFVRVFRDLHQYNGSGPLEGWVRRVFVNVALQYLQKKKKQPEVVELFDYDAPDDVDPFVMDEPPAKQMTQMLQRLPDGFRTVFNLHVLEGYSHPEIAEILGISVGTSKSQLLRAKAYFKKLLENSLQS